MGDPKRVITVPISVAKRNGPYAATAAVQPITPAPCRGECEKMIGNCRNVDALPTPVSRKISSIRATKEGNRSSDVGVSSPVNAMTATQRIRPIPERCVMIPPPTLSEIGPAPVRGRDPREGPRNAYVSGSGAPGEWRRRVLLRGGNGA